ncbi:MAG: hypothetical protein K9G60_02380 [Pseudolabrys sp.]|nr:hypothetical protein [Pseudolabrys sp.]
MSLRRNIVLLLVTAVSAFAFLLPAPTPSLGSIECAAPQYSGALASDGLAPEVDAELAALHRQARLALTQLQDRTVR